MQFPVIKSIILTNYSKITRKLQYKKNWKIWRLMGRINETHVAVAIVTVVVVNAGGEINIPVTLMHGRRKAQLI